MEHLARLDQRQRLEQLVERAEAAGEDARSPPPPSRTSSCARRSGRRCSAMSRYGFAPCSCGSSMLKPTEGRRPRCAPRFAASITPGPPPVTTAQPRLGEQPCPTARAASYGAMPSCDARRAEASPPPAGRSARPPRSPARNSSAIALAARCAARRALVRSSRSCAVVASQRAVRLRREHAEHERDGEQQVERRRSSSARAGRARPPSPARRSRSGPASAAPGERARDAAAVEEADREQVEQVEQEAEVRERQRAAPSRAPCRPRQHDERRRCRRRSGRRAR